MSLELSVHIYQCGFGMKLAWPGPWEGRVVVGQTGVRAWEQQILLTPLLCFSAFLKNCGFTNLFK